MGTSSSALPLAFLRKFLVSSGVAACHGHRAAVDRRTKPHSLQAVGLDHTRAYAHVPKSLKAASVGPSQSEGLIADLPQSSSSRAAVFQAVLSCSVLSMPCPPALFYGGEGGGHHEASFHLASFAGQRLAKRSCTPAAWNAEVAEAAEASQMSCPLPQVLLVCCAHP